MNTVNQHKATSNGVDMQPKIIMGLGNPGNEYTLTYHNVGVSFLFHILKAKNIDAEWKNHKSFASIKINSLTLVHGTTSFMNESGKIAQAILQEFKIQPGSLLVVHDDHDLQLGQYKVAEPGTGSAGHNGVQSIIDSIGNTFPRLRIGISKAKEETPHIKAMDVVLEKITNADQEILNGVFKKILSENSFIPTSE